MSTSSMLRSLKQRSWLGVVGVILLLINGAAAQEMSEGLFVTVQNPITSDSANRIKEETTRYLQRFKAAEQARPAQDRRVPKIVLDFNPNGGSSGTRDFGPCLDLAKYLLQLHEAITIAFVRNDVSRHTVLPVLACKEIVMAERASIGNVLADPGDRLSRAERVAYEEVTETRGLSPAIVLKMLDKDMIVLRARKATDGSAWYVDAKEDEAELKKKRIIVVDRTPVIGAGQLSTLYSAAQARDFGLCQPFFLESRLQLIEKYQLPPTSLRGDVLMGRNPVVWRKEVRGPVNRALDESLRRSIRRAIAQGANLLILQLDCAGGDLLVADELARWLRDLKDDRKQLPVLTVAYIPNQAPDTAAILALGCTEIVMDRNAVFGDFSTVVTSPQQGKLIDLDDQLISLRLKPLEELAELQGYPPILLRGMLDRKLGIYSVKSRTGPEWRLISHEELDQDIQQDKKGAPRRWTNERLIKRGGADGTLLTLRGSDEEKDDAKKLGIARHVVSDARELYAIYGVPADQVRVAGPDWLDELAAFLRSTTVSIFLVMLGITCLILELKLPGVGLPGIVAAICFVLFFWAHSQLAGQITMLAVLLFVLGLILLGLEVFVVPGFGVTGISGAVLIVVSLTLVTLEKKPETTEEWLSFGSNLATFAMSAMGAVVAALVLAWYLPNIPYVNRLVLKPHAEEGEAGPGVEGSLHEMAALLGAIGVAATPLRPAGKAQFGEEFVDVVAEGGYVQPGSRVQVVEIEGNRVVVKEV